MAKFKLSALIYSIIQANILILLIFTKSSLAISNQDYLDQQVKILAPLCAADHYLRTNNQELALLELDQLMLNFDGFQKEFKQNSPLADISNANWQEHLSRLAESYAKGMEQSEANQLDQGREALQLAQDTLTQIRKEAHIFTMSDALIRFGTRMEAIAPYYKEPPDFDNAQANFEYSEKLSAYQVDLELFIEYTPPDTQKLEAYDRLAVILTRAIDHLKRAQANKDGQLVINVMGEILAAHRMMNFQFC